MKRHSFCHLSQILVRYSTCWLVLTLTKALKLPLLVLAVVLADAQPGGYHIASSRVPGIDTVHLPLSTIDI